MLTKKDEEGKIKHTAGTLFDLHEDKIARENLKKINLIMRNNAWSIDLYTYIINLLCFTKCEQLQSFLLGKRIFIDELSYIFYF